MTNSTILIQSVNPSGTFMAFAEQTDTTIYLYIQPHPDLQERFPLRACWVRNLVAAPAHPDTSAMEAGEAPLMPAACCDHPAGLPALGEDSGLSVVWLPSEDGAALLLGKEVLALIPGWSLYLDTPVAYAAACTGEWGTTFPLPPDSAQLRQVADARRIAAAWQDDGASPWPALQEYLLSSYESVFGKHLQYFAIDGGEWPPMAIASFRHEDALLFLTLGVSQRPMPWVDYLYPDTAAAYRRMELGVAVHNDLGEAAAMELAQGIAGLAGMPWKQVSWVGEGHTVTTGAVQPPYESLVFSAALYNGPELPLLTVEGDPVNIYWALPITLAEREFAHSEANQGYTLIEKLIAADAGWIVMPQRAPVV